MLFPYENGSVDASIKITDVFDPDANAALYHGDRLELLASFPPGSQKLIVTSPPYNIGKVYERKRKVTLEDYLVQNQER